MPPAMPNTPEMNDETTIVEPLGATDGSVEAAWDDALRQID